MSTWRMRPTLNQPPNLQNDPAEVLQPEPPTLTEQIKFYCEQLVRLTDHKQGRKTMVLKELRAFGLAPKARKR